MLPISHLAPIIRPSDAIAEGALADAFAAFIASATRMEASYGTLQQEVHKLRRELEARNAQLTFTLTENQQIRAGLRRILDSLPCGVVVLDKRDGTIILMNPESYRLLGLPSDPVSRFENFPQKIRAVLSCAAAANNDHEFPLERPTGTCWLSVRRSTLPISALAPGENGNQQSILILRDITARKEAEEHSSMLPRATMLREDSR